MTSRIYVFLSVLCNFLTISNCRTEKSWDLIYLLKNERNIQVTEDVTVKLTPSTNYSQMILSAKRLFPDNNLPTTFLIYVHFKMEKRLDKPAILLSFKDPDHTTRFQISFKKNPGVIDKIELDVIFNPSSSGKNSTVNVFTLPFTREDLWTFALLIANEKIVLYVTCDDTRRSFGYQSFDVPGVKGGTFFRDGAILQLFGDDDQRNRLQGEIYELSFSNYIRKLDDLCYQPDVEGSGNKGFHIDKDLPGNHLLKTEKMDDEDTMSDTHDITDPPTDSQKIDNITLKNLDYLETSQSQQGKPIQSTDTLRNKVTKAYLSDNNSRTQNTITPLMKTDDQQSVTNNVKPVIPDGEKKEPKVNLSPTPLSKPVVDKDNFKTMSPHNKINKKEFHILPFGPSQKTTERQGSTFSNNVLNTKLTDHTYKSINQEISTTGSIENIINDKNLFRTTSLTKDSSLKKNEKIETSNKNDIFIQNTENGEQYSMYANKGKDANQSNSIENKKDPKTPNKKLLIRSPVLKMSEQDLDTEGIDELRITNISERLLTHQTTRTTRTTSTNKVTIQTNPSITTDLPINTKFNVTITTPSLNTQTELEELSNITHQLSSRGSETSTFPSVNGSKISDPVDKLQKSVKTRHGENGESVKLENICSSQEIDQSKKQQIDRENKEECLKSLSQLRLEIPQKGSKGEPGPKGDPGIKGNTGPPGLNGQCNADACKADYVIKGNKGDPGHCLEKMCLAAKGEKGSIGLKGDMGLKGEQGETNGLNVDLIRHLASSIMQSEIQSTNLLRTNKGEKGDPGPCKCNSQTSSEIPSAERLEENINIGYGSLVFDSREELEKVSSRLPPGSMVFIHRSDLFLIKISQTNNAWRSISLESKSKDWILPPPVNTPKPEITPPYYNSFGKKLHLIALQLAPMGDLKPMLRQPGGYSGAAFQCQQAGAIYGFGRSMYPLINTDTFNLKNVINPKYKSVEIINTRGEVLSKDFHSLLSENDILQNDILDFKRNLISDNIMSPCVWIGKEPKENEPNSNGRCLNWMTRDPLVNGLASMVVPLKSLFSESNKVLRSCNQQCYILCIQTEPYELL